MRSTKKTSSNRTLTIRRMTTSCRPEKNGSPFGKKAKLVKIFLQFADPAVCRLDRLLVFYGEPDIPDLFFELSYVKC